MIYISCTIKELAKACGVSEGTVDRAVNNRSGIRESTKQHILEMAEIERARIKKAHKDISKIKMRASNEMCTFLVINISSLQLIPVNIIAYRSQYGSVNPVGIVVPGLIATGISTLVAVVFCKTASHFRKKEAKNDLKK